MMKVIGGQFRGRNLYSVPGEATRPPLSRVRAAVANILVSYIDSAGVLDLFAGTGSYSIELISRGARFATCIDISPRAIQTIRKNMALLGIENQVEVMEGDALSILRLLERAGKTYDIALVAPPYFTGLDQKAMSALSPGTLISPWGIVVLQQHRREDFRETYGSLRLRKKYSYGDTRISTYTLAPSATNPD